MIADDWDVVRQMCCVQGRIQSRSAFGMSDERTPKA